MRLAIEDYNAKGVTLGGKKVKFEVMAEDDAADPKTATTVAQRIAANGDDPSEYVEISYRISETKFNAWPESLKSAFAPARTLKTGKQGFRLALLQE